MKSLNSIYQPDSEPLSDVSHGDSETQAAIVISQVRQAQPLAAKSPNGGDWLAAHATGAGFHPLIACGVVGIHLIALTAAWCWSWSALAAAGVLLFVTAELGINIGYHRLLTHSSFDCPQWLRRTFAIFGCLALQGGPMTWAALHRIHHRHSDAPLDPHTPRVGFFWAEFLWVFFDHPEIADRESKECLVRDLASDPQLVFIERAYLPLNLAFMILLATIGWIFAGPWGSLSWIVIAGALRIVTIWHLTFIVNAVNHRWGYRNYEIADDSRNNIWISLLVCLGEGWHNNHHAYPRSAAHGHYWFEFDLAYLIIVCLGKVGIVWDIQRPRPLLDRGPA